MRPIAALLAVAVCAACLLAPVKAPAGITNPPHTPLVSVLEIGPTGSWVKVQAIPQTQQPWEFGGKNPKYVEQGLALGDYVCSLYDKIGVLLSQLQDGAVGNLRFYYLVACANP